MSSGMWVACDFPESTVAKASAGVLPAGLLTPSPVTATRGDPSALRMAVMYVPRSAIAICPGFVTIRATDRPVGYRGDPGRPVGGVSTRVARVVTGTRDRDPFLVIRAQCRVI